jgi:hypothetical protein
MCGGGGASQIVSSKGETPEFIRKAAKGNIGAANAYAKQWGGSSKDEKTAYGGIRDNSAWAESMMPYQQGLISDLYLGGGMGEGADYIRDAWSAAAPAYGQYLQPGYLDPMTNPYLQPAIQAAQSGAYNDVADRFHKAGRSFSGSEGAAYGDAVTKAALPMLLGQYNTNVGAQQGAAQGILSGAQGSSAGLTAAQQAVLQARMAAPGQMNNLNIPENMLLGITDRQRQAALAALNAKNSALSGASASYAPSSTQTTTQNSDPFQALMGGGLGLLGLLM